MFILGEEAVVVFELFDGATHPWNNISPPLDCQGKRLSNGGYTYYLCMLLLLVLVIICIALSTVNTFLVCDWAYM